VVGFTRKEASGAPSTFRATTTSWISFQDEFAKDCTQKQIEDMMLATLKESIRVPAQMICLLHPWQDPVPFRRVWCLFELSCLVLSYTRRKLGERSAGGGGPVLPHHPNICSEEPWRAPVSGLASPDMPSSVFH
jgi:hypothetical protein